jgi:lysophospholipase L1-like esterase
VSRAAAALAACLCALALPPAAHAARWVTAWGTATQGAYPLGYNFDPGTSTLLPGGRADDRTFRLVVRPSLAGTALALRLSNAGGTTPVRVDAVTVGPRSRGAALRSVRAVTFRGRRSLTLAPGARVTSDRVALPVAAFADLAVSAHVVRAAAVEWHAMALETNYLARGDATADRGARRFTTTTTGHFLVDGVDVLAARDARAVVGFGDSVTDGSGATRDGHDRWTDALAGLLARRRLPLAVVNRGINGNNVGTRGIVTDGPGGLARLKRDAIGTSGVAVVVLCEGSNDLSNGAPAAEVIAALRRAAATVHAKRIAVVGATAIPRADARWTFAMEAARREVNSWIRSTSAFDAVADFEKAVAGSDGRLDPRYDSGDHLHPGPAGYRALAAAALPAVLTALE